MVCVCLCLCVNVAVVEYGCVIRAWCIVRWCMACFCVLRLFVYVLGLIALVCFICDVRCDVVWFVLRVCAFE